MIYGKEMRESLHIFSLMENAIEKLQFEKK
jgi:hypothetical protein